MKQKSNFRHLCYNINKDEVYCWDCKGVQKKDSTFHSQFSQQVLRVKEEVDERHYD
jgi:hypothetical protein